ncbi:hypothetical protein E3J38_04235 [candidate division TA06 bacterium]|uniref:Exonuclease domain-containing protein n=1 Tax=candidate division TA06 bacterium TaxID=2250710 RepID=A0A523XPT0_UNCT6|nr:MAG: hypothetical protein E3J38_04235 [candidate division TA06 bacterium]
MSPFGDDTPEAETFLDVETTGAQEPKAMSMGEYKIRVVGALIDIDKNNHPYFLPRFEIPSEPYSKDFTSFHGLPHDEMTEKQLNQSKWWLEQFKLCFGLALEGKLTIDQMLRLEGWAILGSKDDPQWGEGNTIRRYLVPK